ncbi:hypothetical protein Y032_0323g2490 [Ancylostoma ceylanicum]|nr:hypothetical protein Y032_0323g2490 [Ancylostoma ceylanicum]
MRFLTLISNPWPKFPASFCVVSYTHSFLRTCNIAYSCMGPRLEEDQEGEFNVGFARAASLCKARASHWVPRYTQWNIDNFPWSPTLSKLSSLQNIGFPMVSKRLHVPLFSAARADTPQISRTISEVRYCL